MQVKENVDRLYKQPDKSAGDTRIVFNQFNLDKMLDAFAVILMRAEDKANPEASKKISKDRWTVAEKIESIQTTLTFKDKVKFSELFDSDYSKGEVINVFLAVLELLKRQKIRVKQEDN